jgi:hypothetical protein
MTLFSNALIRRSVMRTCGSAVHRKYEIVHNLEAISSIGTCESVKQGLKI